MRAVSGSTEATGSAPGRSNAVQHLNDQLRRTGRGGRVMVTAGVAALPEAERAAIIGAVRAFDDFTPDNDLPFGTEARERLTGEPERITLRPEHEASPRSGTDLPVRRWPI